MKDIIVLGAGLSGTLMAIRLAQRGHNVELLEKRPDLRKSNIGAGRSINLALSNRGLKALSMVDLEHEAKKIAIPMFGRMIHPIDEEPKLFRYSGREDEWINSISRPGLNAILLDKAESCKNLNIHFSTDVTKVFSDENVIHYTDPEGNKKMDVSDRIVIGADGAGSALRREMQKISNQIRFNFSQTFLDTGYKELCLPSRDNQIFQIYKNALHIWPRNGFMMIALPNLDASFTVTLFMTFEGSNGFNNIKSDEQITKFFETNFPDVIEFFPDLIEQFRSNPSSSLGTIRCYPWQMNGQYLLLGDAAHAVVPFYGQGMNCAFEDCIILDQCIEENGSDWDSILHNYQRLRKKDADAIADLCEDNFYEMRDATADPVFNRKRQLELKLEQEFPLYYSKYSLVTFREDLPYHIAKERGRKQDIMLMDIAANNKYIDNINLHEIYIKLNQL